MTKDEIQQKAEEAWVAAGMRGLVAMGTGTGKSKLALNIIQRLRKGNKSLRVFLGVPTEGLRDKNWPEEAKAWKLTRVYNECVTGVCYASMKNYRARDFDLIILDEAHRLTDLSSEFFETPEDLLVPVLMLTATAPDSSGNETDRAKAKLLVDLGITTVFKYSLDEAVVDTNVADYKIYLVPCPLDDKIKYLPGGSAKKRFYITEAASYKYLDKKIKAVKIQVVKDETPDPLSEDHSFFIESPKRALLQMLQGQRTRFLYGLKSKAAVARRILKRFSEQKRIIMFCGSIQQSLDLVGADRVYNSKSDDKALIRFKKLKLNVLAVVNAMNEGHNIAELDIAIIVQINSNERDLIQRIGRVVRFRPGHTARIFLLYVEGTQDEKWMRSALQSFDKSRIFELKPSSI